MASLELPSLYEEYKNCAYDSMVSYFAVAGYTPGIIHLK